MSPTLKRDLVLSALGVLIGVSAFFVLFAGYKNYDVGFWSFLSGALAAVCFQLHYLKWKEILDKWYSKVSLRNLHVVGFVSTVAGIIAAIWYIFVTCYYNIPVMPISESTVISAVWAAICGKWGILLMYHSGKYELMLEEGAAPILAENTA